MWTRYSGSVRCFRSRGLRDIESTINRFISGLFTSQHATVSVVNALQQPTNTVQGVGSAQGMYTVQTAKAQIDSYPFQGNG